MPVLHAARALTPEGWRSDVAGHDRKRQRSPPSRPALRRGRATSVTRSWRRRPRTCTATPSSGRWRVWPKRAAGRSTRSGPGARRCTASRFRCRPMTLRRSPRKLYVEMLEAGFAAVAEFHYLHHAPDGSPYESRAEMAGRILSAARRAGIGMTLLPVFYAHSTFGGAPPEPEQRRFVNDVASFARLVDDCRRLLGEADETIGIAPHSLRAVTPRRACRTDRARRRRADPHPCRRADQGGRGLCRLVGRAAGALADRPCGRRRTAGASSTRPTSMNGETRDLARSRRGRRPLSVTEANLGDGVFNAADYIDAGGRYGVGPTPMSASASRRSCVSSSMHKGCVSGRAMFAPRRGDRRAARCSRRSGPAAPRR